MGQVPDILPPTVVPPEVSGAVLLPIRVVPSCVLAPGVLDLVAWSLEEVNSAAEVPLIL